MVSVITLLCACIGLGMVAGRSVPKQSHLFIRRPKSPAKSWLTMVIMLLQENQKLADKLEKVKVENEIANIALQHKLDAITKGIKGQPKSTRCYLGMKFGDIPDSAISASSSVDAKHAPARARLDSEMTGDNFRGGWAASAPPVNEWIEADLGSPMSVTGVILQGRSDMSEWVRSYKVQCDSVTVQEYGSDKVFMGNVDRNTKVVGKFMAPLTCQRVRIVPMTYQVHVTMRFELIRGSCFDEF